MRRDRDSTAPQGAGKKSWSQDADRRRQYDFLTLLKTTIDDKTGGTRPWDVLAIIGAGTDTTSALLTYGMHLLATNPNTQHKVHQEVSSVLGQDIMVDITATRKMKLLGYNIKEMLRLFLSIPANFQCCL